MAPVIRTLVETPPGGTPCGWSSQAFRPEKSSTIRARPTPFKQFSVGLERVVAGPAWAARPFAGTPLSQWRSAGRR